MQFATCIVQHINAHIEFANDSLVGMRLFQHYFLLKHTHTYYNKFELHVSTVKITILRDYYVQSMINSDHKEKHLMRIYIAGSGAMGCRFGYQLYRSGNDVTLLDNWQEHIEAIQRHGLHITGDEDTYVPMRIMRPAQASGSADLIILFTKAMQLENMLRDIQHLIGEHTQVLCLLNGLGHEDVIRKFVPDDHIIMGVTVWTAELKAPGVVFLQSQGTVNVQSLAAQYTDRVRNIITVMNDAHLNVTYDEHVLATIWRKACVNGTMNATCALTNSTVGEFFASEPGLRIVRTIIHEFIMVGKAEGVPLDETAIVDYVLKTANVVAHHYPSMHQDLLHHHRATEIDFINGAIARKGIQYGIATPYCQMITDLIHAKEHILGIH